MWICLRCSEEVDDILEICWHCQATRSGRLSEFPAPPEPQDEPHIARLNRKHQRMQCGRCPGVLRYIGQKRFHEGPSLGALGDFAELLAKQQELEMYHCEQCGHVEFFVF